MADAEAGRRKLDDYLKQLRAKLRGLPEAEAAEIVDELRSHVRDCTESGAELTEPGVIATLERLGPPEELAAMYVTENIMARARRSRSPWLILRSIFHWATVSVAGFFVLMGSLIGYLLALSFIVAALAKPFAPGRVGLWQLEEGSDSFSLHLGFGSPPPGQELLGWWMVPVGLLVGAGLLWLTTRFGLWSLRRFRRPRPIPAN